MYLRSDGRLGFLLRFLLGLLRRSRGRGRGGHLRSSHLSLLLFFLLLLQWRVLRLVVGRTLRRRRGLVNVSFIGGSIVLVLISRSLLLIRGLAGLGSAGLFLFGGRSLLSLTRLGGLRFLGLFGSLSLLSCGFSGGLLLGLLGGLVGVLGVGDLPLGFRGGAGVLLLGLVGSGGRLLVGVIVQFRFLDDFVISASTRTTLCNFSIKFIFLSEPIRTNFM